jgi:hypothetical protein
MSYKTHLPIAVRIYPEPHDSTPNQAQQAERSRRNQQRPSAMLVFDTETRVDATQRLTFGSYRFLRDGECQEEGLFYADDLTESERTLLDRYSKDHEADAIDSKLRFLTLKEFLSRFYRAGYKSRCLMVGFNLPFDLSRLAHDFANARGRFAGGFSLGFWSYFDKDGIERRNQYRPRVGIKHIDGKRALKGFTAQNESDQSDLIPDGSLTGEPEAGYKFRGHFLDLRTLAFALTDRGYTLASASEAFGVERGKQLVDQHGEITEKYIDYNRRDVVATAELAIKLLAEYDRHPIDLQATKAYSPASIGKAYLQAMGIRSVLERQPEFPRRYLGYAQSAFFGGRTSAHIRKTAVPVVYTDFLSMYPTVNCLMGLWDLVTAAEIVVEGHCRAEIIAFLEKVSMDYLFSPAHWKNLVAFVQVIPDGDILPSRGKYSVESNDWQVAMNYLYSDPSNPTALWYPLPDVVASVLLTKRIPKVVDAFRLKGKGKIAGLTPARLRGMVEVDPEMEDFFKVVIEERKRLERRTDTTDEERPRLDKALKVTANATSYGIYAEMNRQESDQEHFVTCHGIDAQPFTCKVKNPEVPGKYCFPPLASLITGAARLMLALLESCVTTFGGTYAMEDTDSMAIVATKRGGLVPCLGGSMLLKTKPAVIALSWKQVDDIAARFAALNPYDRNVISGSILKIEKDNFAPHTKAQRQLYCVAISAKRYVLFLRDRNGEPELLRKGANNEEDRWSEHGLGHLLNPTDPEDEDRKWIGRVWLNVVRRVLQLPVHDLKFDARPAIGRVSASSPATIRPFTTFNAGKSYRWQIKPFNFLLACHIKAFGQPIGTDSVRFHLIAAYENKPRQWLKMKWIDQYTGRTYRITTDGHNGTRGAARVKTYTDVILEYEHHPESKCADSVGMVCDKQTVGLLQRRHVSIDHVKFIGKESNELEDVEAGLVHCENDVYIEYVDRGHDEWQTRYLPTLKEMKPSLLVAASGLSKRAIQDIRAGCSRPHPKNMDRLKAIVDSNWASTDSLSDG